MVDTKVLIAYTARDYIVRSDFYDYLNLMIKPPNSMQAPSHDRSPAHGRNVLIQHALEGDFTHVLFMDDDVVPPEDGLMKLLEWNLDIVSGLLLSKAYPHEPIAFDIADEEGACCPMYLDASRERLREIVAAGFGFCLFKTDIFRKLEKPWVRLGELDPEQWCDDLGFFKRIREAGIKIYCDTDCLVGHIGSMIIRPNKQKGQWYTGYDTGGKGMINTLQVIKLEEVQSGVS